MENDRRTRRTKNLLKHAFVELLAEKKITEITVKELCDKADINRGTFYLHYTDIYDLKQQLENEICLQLEEIVLTHPSLQNSKDSYILFLDLFRFTEKNALLFQTFLGSNGDLSFLRRMQTLFKERYLEILFKGKTPKNASNLDYSYNFIASGFTGLVESWLSSTDSDRSSPEEMAKLVNKIVYDGLPSLLSFL